MRTLFHLTDYPIKTRALGLVVRWMNKEGISFERQRAGEINPRIHPDLTYSIKEAEAAAHIRALSARAGAVHSDSFNEGDICIGIQYGVDSYAFYQDIMSPLGIVVVASCSPGTAIGRFYVPRSMVWRYMTRARNICSQVAETVDPRKIKPDIVSVTTQGKFDSAGYTAKVIMDAIKTKQPGTIQVHLEQETLSPSDLEDLLRQVSFENPAQ